MQYSRREYFLDTQHQHKAKADIKIGAKNDGTITAIDATFYGDDGGLGSTWASSLNFPIANTLRCPDARFAYVEIATNKPWAGIYRSVQNPPGDFVMEVVLDELAEELGMNPLDLRLKNYVTPEEVQQDNGKPYSSNGVLECLKTVAEAIGWDEQWHAPGTKTLDDGRLHGIGIAGCVESHSSASSVVGGIVNLTRDGKAICNQGITRVGCGTNSALCAIVAETLGMSYEDVMTGEWGNLDVAAEACPQWGSQGTINNGQAFLRAAEDARNQLFERAAPLLDVSVDELGIGDGKVFVKADPSKSITIAELASIRGSSPIVGRGYGWPQELQSPLFGWPAGTPCETRCQCASATEVAVDPETGEVEILNIVDSVDAGKVISLDGVQKQIYAGIESIAAQALYWEQILDPATGATLNPNFLDHKFPTPLDMHQDRYQAKPVESIDACGPYGAKGIGEPVITTFASVFGAIHNATGKWFKEVPVYPWRILEALGKV
jgi:xanthine dehydrogenase molybdenum-binding subunit